MSFQAHALNPCSALPRLLILIQARLLRTMLSLSCALSLTALTADEAVGLRAGVARLDITPIQPTTLAGYASRTNLFESVHDPLSVRVVAFAYGEEKLVLVSIDNLGFYNGTADPLRQAILEAHQLEPSQLLLCAIHTHSAPALALDPRKGHPNNVEYTRWLQGKLVASVGQALAGLEPVTLSVGSGSSPVGVNRREVVRDDSGETRVILGRNPHAVTDREVQVVRVARRGSGEQTAVLFGYATHSTSLGPRNYSVSGDVHGLAEQFLERYFGGEVVAPGFAGASGDIDPWVRILPEFRTTNGWVPEPILMGTLLGEEVAMVLEAMKDVDAGGAIRSVFHGVSLPAKSREQGNEDDPVETRTFPVTLAAVGDIAFVGLGGEVFNELGQALKSGSPFGTTVIITHCNGVAGYVPTRSSYGEGGYEVRSSPFAAGAGEELVKTTVRMLHELKDEEH